MEDGDVAAIERRVLCVRGCYSNLAKKIEGKAITTLIQPMQ